MYFASSSEESGLRKELDPVTYDTINNDELTRETSHEINADKKAPPKIIAVSII